MEENYYTLYCGSATCRDGITRLQLQVMDLNKQLGLIGTKNTVYLTSGQTVTVIGEERNSVAPDYIEFWNNDKIVASFRRDHIAGMTKE